MLHALLIALIISTQAQYEQFPVDEPNLPSMKISGDANEAKAQEQLSEMLATTKMSNEEKSNDSKVSPGVAADATAIFDTSDDQTKPKSSANVGHENHLQGPKPELESNSTEKSMGLTPEAQNNATSSEKDLQTSSISFVQPDSSRKSAGYELIDQTTHESSSSLEGPADGKQEIDYVNSVHLNTYEIPRNDTNAMNSDSAETSTSEKESVPYDSKAETPYGNEVPTDAPSESATTTVDSSYSEPPESKEKSTMPTSETTFTVTDATDEFSGSLGEKSPSASEPGLGSNAVDQATYGPDDIPETLTTSPSSPAVTEPSKAEEYATYPEISSSPEPTLETSTSIQETISPEHDVSAVSEYPSEPNSPSHSPINYSSPSESASQASQGPDDSVPMITETNEFHGNHPTIPASVVDQNQEKSAEMHSTSRITGSSTKTSSPNSIEEIVNIALTGKSSATYDLTPSIQNLPPKATESVHVEGSGDIPFTVERPYDLQPPFEQLIPHSEVPLMRSSPAPPTSTEIHDAKLLPYKESSEIDGSGMPQEGSGDASFITSTESHDVEGSGTGSSYLTDSEAFLPASSTESLPAEARDIPSTNIEIEDNQTDEVETTKAISSTKTPKRRRRTKKPAVIDSTKSNLAPMEEKQGPLSAIESAEADDPNSLVVLTAVDDNTGKELETRDGTAEIERDNSESEDLEGQLNSAENLDEPKEMETEDEHLDEEGKSSENQGKQGDHSEELEDEIDDYGQNPLDQSQDEKRFDEGEEIETEANDGQTTIVPTTILTMETRKSRSTLRKIQITPSSTITTTAAAATTTAESSTSASSTKKSRKRIRHRKPTPTTTTFDPLPSPVSLPVEIQETVEDLVGPPEDQGEQTTVHATTENLANEEKRRSRLPITKKKLRNSMSTTTAESPESDESDQSEEAETAEQSDNSLDYEADDSEPNDYTEALEEVIEPELEPMNEEETGSDSINENPTNPKGTAHGSEAISNRDERRKSKKSKNNNDDLNESLSTTPIALRTTTGRRPKFHPVANQKVNLTLLEEHVRPEAPPVTTNKRPRSSRTTTLAPEHHVTIDSIPEPNTLFSAQIPKTDSGSLSMILSRKEPIVIVKHHESDTETHGIRSRKRVHKLKTKRVRVVHRKKLDRLDLPTASGSGYGEQFEEQKEVGKGQTTPSTYVTAPGEKTAAPGATLTPAASDLAAQDNPAEGPITVTYLTTVTTTAPFSILEPSGYDSIYEELPPLLSPQLPPPKPEEAVGYEIPLDHNVLQSDSPQPTSQDLSVNSAVKDLIRNQPLISTPKPWSPYRFDCTNEVDDKGELCKEWAQGGLCELHRPTMFLFCRRTCLCTGPFAKLRR